MSAGAAGRSACGPQGDPQSQACDAELVSHFGHELRTPLNSILGFAQILALDPSEPLSPVQKERVDRIQTAGWQMLQSIRDMEELARLDAGRLDIALTAVSLEPLIGSSLAHLDSQAAACRMRLAPEADLQAMVQADPARLQQALVNLLAGVLRCGRAGDVVRIGVRRGADQVAIWIGDSEQAMTMEQLRCAFLPLERPAQASASGRGVQIGLALAQKLVQRMGGGLRIERGAVRGCELQVLLRTP
jgi:signal transduction histidine kinase